jgi:hypothetical protein
MKLSDNTINILKNFSTINKAIEVKAGNTLATISPAKTIFAKTAVEENFEVPFAIYELPKFLGALSLFSSPELTFSEKYVTISENNQKIRYTYCDPSTIVVAPSKDISLPDTIASVEIKGSAIQSLLKSLGVLGLPEIVIFGDGASVYIAAANSKNPSTDEYSIKLADSEAEFKIFFNKENFKLLERDYTVSLSKSGLAEFVSGDLKYFIIGEAK